MIKNEDLKRFTADEENVESVAYTSGPKGMVQVVKMKRTKDGGFICPNSWKEWWF